MPSIAPNCVLTTTPSQLNEVLPYFVSAHNSLTDAACTIGLGTLLTMKNKILLKPILYFSFPHFQKPFFLLKKVAIIVKLNRIMHTV